MKDTLLSLMLLAHRCLCGSLHIVSMFVSKISTAAH